MSDAFTNFEERLNSLERKHKELANGYVAKINPDGLITVEPKGNRKGLGLRLLLLVAMGVVLFKAATLAIIGQATYDSRVETLSAGTTFEQVCAWLMQADRVSLKLANVFTSFFG